MYDFQNCLIEAIDRVLASDLIDESFSAAVHAQALLFARIPAEDMRWYYAD